MFNLTVRDEIVDAVNSPIGRRQGINALIPDNNFLSMVNDTLLDTIVGAIQRGEAEPCVTNVVDGEWNEICKALPNDLVDVMEETRYPVTISIAETILWSRLIIYPTSLRTHC